MSRGKGYFNAYWVTRMPCARAQPWRQDGGSVTYNIHLYQIRELLSVLVKEASMHAWSLAPSWCGRTAESR